MDLPVVPVVFRPVEYALLITAECALETDGRIEAGHGGAAAKVCAHVTALDVSTMMIDYASSKAREEKLENIDFYHAGFLSFDYPPQAYDAVVTGMALHHLPDVWKMVALEKIFSSLKAGGFFYLLDVVFDWGNGSPEEYFQRIIESEFEARPNLSRHISQEFSTTGWIMTGLLTRAGFIIESDVQSRGFLRSYCCRKPEKSRF